MVCVLQNALKKKQIGQLRKKLADMFFTLELVCEEKTKTQDQHTKALCDMCDDSKLLPASIAIFSREDMERDKCCL